MKKILTLLLILVSASVTAQNDNWEEKIAKKFYSSIDSSKKFNCCDEVTNCISVEYTFPIYELPYNSTQEAFDQYYNETIDSLTIDIIVEDLVKCYKKIPKKFRNKFTKTCFDIGTETKIDHGYRSELFFTEGQIHFVFSFQMDKPYKRNIFMKLHDLVSGH